MSSSDTDSELLLFTRADQRGILDVVRTEVGLNLSEGVECFSDSLVTSEPEGNDCDGQRSSAGGQASRAAPMSVVGSGRSAAPDSSPAPAAVSRPAPVGGSARLSPSPSLPSPSSLSVPSPSSLSVPSPCSPSLPAVSRWPGQLAFSLTVAQPERPASGPPGRRPAYVYNRLTGKLYTDLLTAVPVRFSCRGARRPGELQVRAMPVYCEPQHAHTPVRRCALHRDATHPFNAGVQHVRHVLRTRTLLARYDEHGERCSVVVRLDPRSTEHAEHTVLYEFCCMNTCVGGMNRRRLLVVFSLEERRSGQVLGRQSVEVKVCKCPHRDHRADLKRDADSAHPDSAEKKTRPPAPAAQTGADGRLSVTADDEVMYRALVELRDSLRRYRRSLTSTGVSPAGRQ